MVTALAAATDAESALYDGLIAARVGGANRHLGHRFVLVVLVVLRSVVLRVLHDARGDFDSLLHTVFVVGQECHALRAGDP